MNWYNYILGSEPAAGVMVIISLIIIEGVLSVDNAAVLATMVMKLPEQQRGRALRYGIIGAYVFRGICLLIASQLMKIWWLEALGGVYLLYLCFAHFAKKPHVAATPDAAQGNFFYRHTIGKLGTFWATVAAVEVMDLAFSLDNVFAAVAFTKNKVLYPPPSDLILVCIGVFIGILAMRFAAQGFVKLMHTYPFLEKCAYIVIGVLGTKLLLSIPRHYYAEGNPLHDFLASKYFDLGTSLLTLLIFVVPVILYRWKTRTTSI